MTSCAGPSEIRLPAANQAHPDRFQLTTVPFFPQKDYQCGPAALAMTLTWSGVAVTPQDLVAEVFTASKKGSLQSAMVAAVRRHDRIAYLLAGPQSLTAEIAAGNPVVVLQNLGLSWYPVWHYAVVIGWSADSRLILHSGTTPFKQISLKTFERTWARSHFWGLLVLPPDRLPADASETRYLQAVSQLERLGRWDIAARGYEAARDRWPNSLAALMGLGVCRYQAGDLPSAEAVFRQATVTFPSEGVAFNNLAQVLIDQGRRTEALAAVRQAILLGGPFQAQFEQTLEEIRNQ
ncbi:MAG: PA2778 family cysteine peptidase [Desulfosarcina sp.]|jgi:hypothetical protein